MLALKPLLDKAKKTDQKKFGQVLENYLSSPEENGLNAVTKYLPALGIFSTVLSLVGNLVISERTITSEDLNQFIAKVSQYFYQYQKLNEINMEFSLQVQKLLDKTEETKQDLKEFLIECIHTLNENIQLQTLKTLSVEVLLQKYYDPQKLNTYLDTAHLTIKNMLYPPDASTTIKFVTSAIKKLHKEFENLYNDNYKQFNELMNSLRATIPTLDQNQLNKTSSEIDKLYTESRHADLIDLNFNQVDERMNTACKMINAGRQIGY